MSELEKLKIKKSNIKKLVDQYDWKGSGTETDSYIIEATQDLPRALHFKTKALYVKMLNVQHFSVKLKQCQNFTIENCAFCHLEVQECWNIDIKNSLFGSLTISNLKGNTFENNKIEKQGLKGLYHHKPNENAGRVLIVLFFVEFLLLSLILNIIGYTYWNYISILKSTWIVLFYFLQPQ